ncbi:FtsX-like permease family protein [Chitinophaga sp. SYP-B3965]|uniref:ABC transporter permease n=1 Tax=Chitinophaga sp. SYP-B3965 TaxID=2663120 RepID=UPI0012995E8E|nr:ABC transporter permease [Chitinophaga sp. SYP-B3965]MRG45108.1 FtsX-like permease family protein [Chitinophaga sp. SYP-B3965]
MFRNHLKIALRHLWKHRSYTAINLAGLVIGLAACWIILLHVGDELSYDRFHEKGDRIYRVVNAASWDGGSLDLATSSVPQGPALKNNFPEVIAQTRIVPEGGGSLLSAGDKKVQPGEALLADSNIFQVFTFPFIAGDPAKALTAPNSIVLTKSLAAKLFTDPAAALGKSVTWNGDKDVDLVTGVMEDVPHNSHIQFTALRTLPKDFTSKWDNFSIYTYLLLQPGTDAQKISSKSQAFYDQYMKADMGDGVNFRMSLQPLQDIHLNSHLNYDTGANGNKRSVYIFSMVAILILLIACINYMNISTARSSVRVKEIGVRKTLGSVQSQVAGMFLIESVILTLMAAVLAAIVTSAALPVFNNIAGKSLSLWQYGVGYTLLSLTLFSLAAGLLAGSYPAFFMSGFKTINALKGKLNNKVGNAAFRKVLVSFQFVVAIILIAVSIVTWLQMEYVNKKDLGFAKDQILTFHLNDMALRERIPAIKAELKKSPYIENISAASNPIGNNNIGSNGFKAEKDGKFEKGSLITQTFYADADFMPAMGIQLVAGRNFDVNTPGEKYTTILVNETMVKEMGLKDPIGKRVQYEADTIRERRIIGVVKDFHIYSLQHKIAPMAIMLPIFSSWEDNLYVRLNKDHIPEAMKHLEKVYAEFEKTYPLEMHFLDENFSHQYFAEQTQSKVFLIFTCLAIFIACLGLFGLAAFTAEQRTKEIGIRKVLGASVASITGMLSKDFLKLVLIAAILAIPVAWWSMQVWLKDFAYRISLSWWMFAAAGLLAIVITLATVGYQAMRAALANPAKSLRAD